MSHYPKMASILITASLTAIPSFASEEPDSSFYIGIDNDSIVTTDKDYSNGLFFVYSSEFTVEPNGFFDSLPGTHFSSDPTGNTRHKYSLELGQKMWTPEDIENPDPIADERPYAGLLYLSSTLYSISPETINSYSLMMGTVGPNAYAEETQKYVHSIIKSDDPQGWDNQIDNQFVMNFGYNRTDKWHQTELSGSTTHEFSIPSRVLVGNYKSEIASGLMWRWGTDLNRSFGSAKVNNESTIDPSLIVRTNTGWYMFGGVEGRVRFNDITIDGDRPDDGITANEVEHLQGTASVGITGYYRGWGASLSLSTKSRDYKEDDKGVHTNGSLALFLLF
ncbi:exonuclease [Vibrio inusitatus NBRC 102082]|uniref:Exonuclease n=1 Tax=Vibrio inusitatus NBRC 102082 TaxID=1219070 RepID=A0A4Y3HTZ1_9VIBR|nr:lipid A deacylase LpxR family protein [Vibrio inusitatus]GEA49764.1 exonuclease [Vibrio inusitatus NBRC 102082]